MKFYQMEKEELIQDYQINPETGLSEEKVEQQRLKFGENRLPEDEEISYIKMFLSNFKEPIVIILLISVLLSLGSAAFSTFVQNDVQHGRASLYEAAAILFLVLVNAFLGFYQELKSRKSLKALKEMNNRETMVLRNGHWQKIKAPELVVGDLVKVGVGDFVEADVRWFETNELQIIEAHLTGESDAIEKNTEAIKETVEVGDCTNMGFSGSSVTNGNGIGIVVAVGKDTELGRIAQLIQAVPESPSPLQKNIHQLTRTLMILSGSIVVFTFIVGIIRAGEFSFTSIGSVLSTSIALAVASIPDALPAVLSIVLTIGAAKMVKNKGLIKSLNRVETLGATSYICSDKTGTLTKNEMTVVKFYANGQFYSVEGLGYDPKGSILSDDADNDATHYHSFLLGALLCNEASVKEIEGKYQPFGNPTEVALTVLGGKAGLSKKKLIDEGYEIVRTLPFTSERKMMSVIVKRNDDFYVYTKGAPEMVVEHSTQLLNRGEVKDIATEKAAFLDVVDTYAEQALRTLAVAQRKISEKEALEATVDELEQDLLLTGMAGIIDPARKEVKTSIDTLHQANIDVVMITGDHEKTAKAIALDLGIVSSKESTVIKGIEIEQMSDEELFETVKSTNVYARVSPEHKQRIVRQLQRHGEIVAMTGDGVNDAPALKAADIGIAMGITGTEITKDSADLILLDDRFTTIEQSVASGRTIYANIMNFIRHELTTNVAEVLSLLIGLLFFTKTIGQVTGGTPVLTALMVLWVNMISDAVPSFALGYDVAESDIMKEKPRNPKASVLSGQTWSRVLIRGTIMGLLVYVAFLWAANQGMTSNQAQTTAFLTLVYGQLWHVFDARCRQSIFRRNPFENKHLLVAVAFAGVTSFLITFVPFFQVVMGTATLNWMTYLLVLFVPAIPTFLLSGIKEIFGIRWW